MEIAVSAMTEQNAASIARIRLQALDEDTDLMTFEDGPRSGEPAFPVDLAEPRRQESTGVVPADANSAGASGILRTIQRPLSSIGRMFSEDSSALPTKLAASYVG